jgi:hypothetical protein
LLVSVSRSVQTPEQQICLPGHVWQATPQLRGLFWKSLWQSPRQQTAPLGQ